MATEKQIAANRRNGALGKGPVSSAGKGRSSRNALTHGLTATVVVPGEDAAELALRVAMMQDSLAPEGDGASLIFAERLGYLSMRLKRCYQHEVAVTARRVRDAIPDYDEARRAEADRTFDYIAHEPVAGIRRLEATPEGIDLLIRKLAELREHADGRWNAELGMRFDQATGRRPGFAPVSRVAALSEFLGRNNAEYLDPAELAAIAPAERRDWAIAQIGPLIDAAVARLEGLRPTLDHDRHARNRETAPGRAARSADPELIRLAKYEAAADLAFERTYRQLKAHRREHGLGPGATIPAADLTALRAATDHECSGEMAEVRQALQPPEPPALAAPPSARPAAGRPELGSFSPAATKPARPADASTFTIGKPPVEPPSPPRRPRRGP